MRNQAPLLRWIKGPPVMLEKPPGKILASKLRIIQADFSASHKITFNHWIFTTIENHKLIPSEIAGGRKGQASIHAALKKKLIPDTSNQVKAPSVVTSADATKYYDRVDHMLDSLSAHHFGVHINYLLVLLQATQSMSMCLQTAFDTSYSFYAGSIAIIFQVAAKDNGAALALWILIVIILSYSSVSKALSQNVALPRRI